MPSDTDQLQLFRAIRGAPATILMLLIVRGAAMTNLEICHWTGYTDKPVTTALAVLQHLGLLQYNGRQYGWSLCAGYQARLPFIHSLPELVDKEIGFFPMIGNSPIYPPTTTTAATNGRDQNQLERSSSSSNGDRKNSDLDMSTRPLDRKNSDLDMSTHPLLDRKNSDLGTNSNGCGPQPDKRVAHWLQQAGVGTGSKKYRQLLAENLDWRTVRAHALERLAMPDEIKVGLFITRLLDRDPAPVPPRCPECYWPLNDYGHCTRFSCCYIGEDEDDEEDEEE